MHNLIKDFAYFVYYDLYIHAYSCIKYWKAYNFKGFLPFPFAEHT